MSTKTKLFIVSLITLWGIFASGSLALAQTVVPTCNSATIYGTVTTNGNPTDAWFEWGPTQSLGNSTAHQTFYSDSNFSQSISGLAQNTTYYYRAMASNVYGTAVGTIKYFTTSTCSVTPITNPTASLTADNTNLTYNGSTYLHWSSTNATSCVGTGFNTNNTTSGNYYTGALTNTTTYGITCYGGTSTTPAYSSVTVIVNQPVVNPPTVTLTADNQNVPYDGSTYIHWTPTNATSCTGSGGANGWSGTKSITGGSFYTGALTYTATYNINCTNSAGQANASVTVNVPSQSIMSGTLALNPSSCIIQSGSGTCSSILSWSTTNPQGTSVVTSSYPSSNTPVATGNSGSQSVAIPYSSRSFYLYNNNILLDQKTATSSCASNTSWNGSICAPSTSQNPTVSLTADNQNVSYGGSTYLHWSSANTTSCVGTNFNTNSATSGSYYTGALTNTTTYSIICYNTNAIGNPSISDSVTITVGGQPVSNPTVSLTADNQNVSYNSATYLRWSSTNATSCVSNGGNWNGNQALSGNFYTGILLNTTTYNITCTNGNGSATASTTVTVDNQPSSNPTVTLTAINQNVSYNGSTYIHWTSTSATSCVGTGFNTSGAISGSYYTGALTNTMNYGIICYGANGTSANASTTVVVGNQPYGNINITTNGATNVGTSYATLNGFVSSNGTISVNAWFEWGTSSSFGNQTNQINYGMTSGTSYNYYLSGLMQNTTYYYRAVAQGNDGQIAYGNSMSFTTTNDYSGCTYNCYSGQPMVTTYSATTTSTTSAILNGFVDPNGSSATRWFEWGNSYSYLYTSTNKTYQGSYASNFSESIYNLVPNTIYYYRAAAQGSNGVIIYGNTLTFTTSYSGGIYNYNNVCDSYGGGYYGYGTCTPTATTTLATNIGQSSARLGGLGLVNGNIYTSGYFEYGTSQAFGSTTTTMSIGTASSNPFFADVYNLASGTTYYYRAVVTNQYGSSYGDTLNFTTLSPTYVNSNPGPVYTKTTVVTNTSTAGTAVNSKSSLALLSVSRDGENITKGDTVEYVINYKNVSSKNLKNVVLQVAIPKELEFVETNRGYFSTDNGTVIANIGGLNSQEEGSVSIRIKVTTDAQTGKIVVITANLAYTRTDNNTQEEVFAYAKNTVQDSGAVQQGALAFLFGNGFLPTTLIGWLLLILLLTLVVLAVKKAYSEANFVLAPKSSTKSHS